MRESVTLLADQAQERSSNMKIMSIETFQYWQRAVSGSLTCLECTVLDKTAYFKIAGHEVVL